MLIDDDALVRNSLAETLADEGIEVDGLANAEDAIILLGSGQAPDVVVTDIDLGIGLSGLDLATIARERHPDVEIILISGTTFDPGRRAVSEHERFLSKPFVPSVLADAIREAVGQAEKRRAPMVSGD
jgi:DNA-binding NtrC family response regulator